MTQTQTMLMQQEHVDTARGHVERLMQGVVFASPLLFTLDDVFDRLRDGRMQLWLFFEKGELPHLFAITLLEKFPRGTICHVFMAAGKDFRSIVRFRPGFERWCKDLGVDYIHFDAAPKMARIMKRYGYHATAMAVYKPLHTMN